MPTIERASRASLAVAQTCPIRGDVDANIDQHLRLARAATDAGAALVLFPELSLTGYELDLAPDLAFTVGDPRLAPLAAGATNLDITMIVGAPARVDSSLHIGAFILGPGGNFGEATGGLCAAGRSAIWSATGERLVQLGPHGPAVGIVTATTRGWAAKVLEDADCQALR